MIGDHLNVSHQKATNNAQNSTELQKQQFLVGGVNHNVLLLCGHFSDF